MNIDRELGFWFNRVQVLSQSFRMFRFRVCLLDNTFTHSAHTYTECISQWAMVILKILIRKGFKIMWKFTNLQLQYSVICHHLHPIKTLKNHTINNYSLWPSPLHIKNGKIIAGFVTGHQYNQWNGINLWFHFLKKISYFMLFNQGATNCWWLYISP